MILKCTCINETQDKLYGQGNRVFNPRKPKESTSHYRCSVCKKETSESQKQPNHAKLYFFKIKGQG